MENQTKIKVGSKLVDGGTVYLVTKIAIEKVLDKSEKVLYYKPFYKNVNNAGLYCSIPERNLSVANIRMPLTKEEIDELFSVLATGVKEKTELEVDEALNILSLNKTLEIAYVIKKYSKEKAKKGTDFGKTKNDLLEKAFALITEEVALVTKTSPEDAKNKLSSAMNL